MSDPIEASLPPPAYIQRALLSLYTALSSLYRALLSAYRALVSEGIQFSFECI